VAVGDGLLAVLAGGTAGALYFASLYLQVGLEYPPMAVGFAFAPVTVVVLVVSPLAGRLVTRVGVRPVLVTGAGATAVGLVVLSGLDVGGSYVADVLPGLLLVAVGNGLAFAPTMITATSGVTEREQGVASGLVSTAQELGTAIGLASLAAIAAAAAGTSGLDGVHGYRVGFLAAAALVAVGVLLAALAPRGLGQEADGQEAEG
jgi:MFS family permease